MSKGRLLIFGAGGHGRVVADTAEAGGEWSEIAFIDDKYPDLCSSGSWPVVGSSSDMQQLRNSWDAIVIAIGDNRLRYELQQTASSAGFPLATIVHPSAQIAGQIEIGEGSVVFANAVINSGSRLGRSVILNTAATIDHDCVIGDGVHISPGAHIAGDVVVAKLAWVGIGSVIINGVAVGEAAIVAAGAAVISDVDIGQTVAGVPATTIKME